MLKVAFLLTWVLVASHLSSPQTTGRAPASDRTISQMETMAINSGF